MAAHGRNPPDNLKGNGVFRKDKRHLDNRGVDELLTSLANGGDSDVSDIESDFDPEFVPAMEDVVSEHDSNSEEDNSDVEELVHAPQQPRKRTSNKSTFKWIEQDFPTRDVTWTDDPDPLDYDVMPTPYDLFSEYFNDDFFSSVAEYTNIYSIQRSGNSLDTCLEEIRAFFANHIIMGTLGFPQIRLYWNALSRIRAVADSMTLNRFYQLRSNLHLVNNLSPINKEDDRLWKVRPIINVFTERCHKLPLEEFLCIDEQIIPFKGHLSIKQYVKNKPTPWGIKNFLLCGKSGLVYDILPYQGKTTRFLENANEDVGLGGKVVLTLAQRIPEMKMYKLYFDNYFSSLPLMTVLVNKKIAAAGTIRKNRTGKCPMPTEKEMAKLGRGKSKVFTETTSNIAITTWRDNKNVTLVSNYVARGLEDTANRWEKSQKSYMLVQRPEVVQHYNTSMGGVDGMDALISYYRIFIQSRKWPLRVIFHFVDMSLCNSWLLYRRIAQIHKIPDKKTLKLFEFRMEVAESLQKTNLIPGAKRRGRPSLNSENDNVCLQTAVGSKKRKIAFSSPKPSTSVRFDSIGHFPMLTEKKSSQRCSLEGCLGQTRFMCEKCERHLCLTRDKNCFKIYHVKI